MKDIEVEKAYKMMKEQDKINFGKYHTFIYTYLSSYDFKLYDEWNKQYFYLLAKMKYLELQKESILYSGYSNINDLKEFRYFKNYKNLKEMLSYFILVYSIYTNGISIIVVTDLLCEEE